MIHGIIVAAGKGKRFGGENPKQFIVIGEKRVVEWSISKVEKFVDSIIVVIPPEIDFRCKFKTVIGGDNRAESVFNAVSSLPIKGGDLVLIHDAVRPAVNPIDIERVIESAKSNHGAVLASKVTDTLKLVECNYIIKTVDRDKLWKVQTPQVFQADIFFESLKTGLNEKLYFTDDSAYLERQGYKVAVVEALKPNPKLTYKKDLSIIKSILLDG